MNATTRVIIDLLPKKPLLAPADVSAAYGLKTSDMILADIKTGKLEVNKLGGKYIISREAAEAYVIANEYTPEEGEIHK